MKKSAHITLSLLGALVFWSADAAAQTRYRVDFTIPVKDFSGGHIVSNVPWIVFRDASNDNLIWIPQFITTCDRTIEHAANERRDHCNSNIQVRIRGLAYWANGAMAVDQYTHCDIVNDSWENKCVAATTTTTTAAAAAAAATTSSETETTITASEQTATIVVNE